MKLTKWFLPFALAGSCLNQASAQLSTPASRFIGDIQPATDERPPQFQEAASRTISHSWDIDDAMLAPTSASYVSDVGEAGCKGDCGGSCGSVSCGSVSCGSALSCSPKATGWFTAETLLWFGREQDAAGLNTISQQGQLLIPGNQINTTDFTGAEAIATGLLPGYRLSAGRYLGDCDQFGVGGRVFGLYSNEQSASSTLFGLVTPADPAVEVGQLTARSELDMVGAEGSLYLLLGESDDHRVDLIGGYTFNRLKNSLGLQASSENVDIGDAVANGTLFQTSDLYETENVFHGGHIGILSTTVHSRVSLSTLAKVSFGNMRQSGSIRGSTDVTLNGNTQQFTDGLIATGNNLGSFSRDEFAFIPELGVKLGYSFRENVQLTAGYTFLMYSSVFMAGDQSAPNVDLTQNVDQANLRDTSFWLQGIDLGLSFTY